MNNIVSKLTYKIMKFKDVVVPRRSKPDGEPGAIDLDEVLAEIGPLGKFQWKQLVLFYFVGIACGVAVVSFSFTGMFMVKNQLYALA